MANKLVTISTTTLLVLFLGTIAIAQSGSRGITGGGGGGITGGIGGTSGSSGFSTGGAFGYNSRLSSAERARLQQQQIAQANELARQNAELQQKFLAAQREQLLASLGRQPDGALNRKFRRLAFNEAKKEFKALRKMQLSVAEAGGFLEQPFRLPSMTAKTVKGDQIKWPDALSDASHEQTKLAVEGLIKSTEATPEEIKTALKQLSSELGQRAIKGEIKSNDYARGKRFLTGLSHELG